MNLKKFERTIFLLNLLLGLSIFVSGIVSWYLLSEVLELGNGIVVSGSLLVVFLTALLASYRVSKSALGPTDAVHKALSHMSSSAGNDVPPNADSYTMSKELVSELLRDVYSLRSGHDDRQMALSNSADLAQAMLELQSSPILALDRNHQIRFANHAATDVMPESIDNPIGMTIEDALAPEFSSGEKFLDWVHDIQSNKVADRQVWERVKITLNDGKVRYFDMAADYHKNESHGVEIIIVMIDKTHSYHADDNAMNFVSLAVHELRSPISLLRGYIEVFQDEIGPQLDEGQRGFMDKMSVSAAQLSTFVNNILNVARIESDKLKVHLHKDDISKVLESSKPDFELRAKVRNRNLVYSLPEGLPNVGIDRVGIYEVMNNLVDNAIKYSPDGGEIKINADKTEAGGIVVTVEDKGVGIPTSSMENLFERFYRSHHTSDTVPGTGLGLFLSKTIIEAHGGTIWVKSTEGEGATFGFELPEFGSVSSDEENSSGNDEIIRTAHGWIKNHGKLRR